MKIKRLIITVLSTAMMMSLLGTTVLADNENFSDETNSVLNGIIKTNDGVNVSNIKVDIMTSELKQSENDVFIYENTYAYSVYTDDNGAYSFSKPSENCLVQIDLNSIPERTGVDKQSCFVDCMNSLEDFTIDEIADVKFNDINNVTVYDAYRNELVTNVDVEMNTQNVSMYGLDASSDLTAYCTANANGYIETANVDITIDGNDLISKADTMYAIGAISNTEKAEMYLNALITKDYGDQECLTFIYDELNNYLATGVDRALADEIFSYIGENDKMRSAVPDEANYTTEGTRTVSNSKISYTLHYGKSHANNYLASVGTPFTDISNNRSYGMFLFPQYLSQTYGGLNSIKRTLEYVSSGYPVLKSMEKSAQYSDNSATYGEIFAMFQRCNADPRRYVNSSGSDGRYNEATRRLDNVETASNIPVVSTAAVHYGLQASSTTSAVSVTVDITSGSYTNAMFKLVKFPGDGGSSVYVNYKPTSTSFTIYVSSFKTGTTSSVYPRLTLVASNTSDDYTTSYKFGLTRTNK